MKNLKFEKIDNSKFDALSIENMKSIKGANEAFATIEAATLDTITIKVKNGVKTTDSDTAENDGVKND